MIKGNEKDEERRLATEGPTSNKALRLTEPFEATDTKLSASSPKHQAKRSEDVLVEKKRTEFAKNGLEEGMDGTESPANNKQKGNYSCFLYKTWCF